MCISQVQFVETTVDMDKSVSLKCNSVHLHVRPLAMKSFLAAPIKPSASKPQYLVAILCAFVFLWAHQ